MKTSHALRKTVAVWGTATLSRCFRLLFIYVIEINLNKKHIPELSGM